MNIHPSASIDPLAELDSSVVVKANAVIAANVKIDAGCTIGVGAVIEGYTTIGKYNTVHAYAVIGGTPQDKKYTGEPTGLLIGDHNTFRECVTINTGTVQDLGLTTIGSNNWVMAYVHIAHDCIIGSHTIIANATQLAGHVQIGDWVILGGMTAVHQFCRVGAHAMTGAGTVLLQDVPPYVMVQGYPAKPHGLNTEGLKRRGFTSEDLLWIKRAYRLLYRDNLKLDAAQLAIAKILNDCGISREKIAVFSDFISQSGRGFVR
jgi:UDP-N-acetylglucosamine acyltransferase